MYSQFNTRFSVISSIFQSNLKEKKNFHEQSPRLFLLSENIGFFRLLEKILNANISKLNFLDYIGGACWAEF